MSILLGNDTRIMLPKLKIVGFAYFTVSILLGNDTRIMLSKLKIVRLVLLILLRVFY